MRLFLEEPQDGHDFTGIGRDLISMRPGEKVTEVRKKKFRILNLSLDFKV